MAGRLSVATEFEDGLLGIALAPDFAASDHIYLFYSPAGPEAVQRVSRFTLRLERGVRLAALCDVAAWPTVPRWPSFSPPPWRGT